MTKRTKSYLGKQKQGYKAALKGKDFEKKIGAFLSKQGYKIDYEKPICKGSKEKFDVFGIMYDELGYEEYCIAECKDKPRVTATDVLHFMSKLREFHKRLPAYDFGDKPEVLGLLAYTGELPRDARNAAEASKLSIKFKKF